MKQLSPEQVNWICSKIASLISKYTPKLPLSDDDAQALHDEAIMIGHKSRDDELCQMLLISVFEYFDKLNNEVRRGANEQHNKDDL